MRKIIASLVSVSILVFSCVPVQAGGPDKVLRGLKAMAKSKKFTPTKFTYRPNMSLPAVRRLPTTQPVLPAHKTPVTPQTQQELQRGVRKAVLKATLPNTLSLKEIQRRLADGKTAQLAGRILAYPNAAVREGLLRNEFVQVALAGHATPEQIAQAAEFWRQDLQTALSSFDALPEGNLNTLTEAFRQKNAAVATANEALADAAALGLYGSAQDGALILELYRKAARTPLAPLAEATAARALLRLGAQQELAALAAESGSQAELWQSVSAYAEKQGVALNRGEAQPAAVHAADVFRPALKKFGKINLLAADPSREATSLYMALGRTQAAPVKLPAGKTAPWPGDIALPQVSLAATPSLQAEALSIAGGENTAAQTAAPTALAKAFQKANPQAAQAKATAADNSGVLYGGIPVPALWKNLKKVFSSVKKRASAKTAAAPEPVLPATGWKGTLQRASLYLASAVMGLEVATPVIANFGSSFGLSLSDNILVAVATYLPYSVGAFLSNWLKQKIGRKASMNLGLALMGGAFTAGVTLFGLNGSFVPQADAMAHFYNILACITLASTGGVFVHNAVGPIMTDLSAGASELSLQRRNANTELSRALGMAASFAFPFLSTKVLGMDWSFTFALPIPLVAAAALGINLSRIPNTKPVLEPKPAAAPAEAAVQGKRNRRAYQLTSSLQNNSYVRLFKEEKGVAALLAGLFIMNAVEMSFNNGFMFLLPSLTKDPSSQYLFGLLQFAAPFLLGRYLARNFLKWFPKNNMSVATSIAAAGGLAALPLASNVYALTAALFAAEVGISTTFTLAFARSATNSRTQDRIISLIVASAISCAFGPMLLTHLAQGFIDTGALTTSGATAAALIGVPSLLAALSALLFKRLERSHAKAAADGPDAVLNTQKTAKTASWVQRLIARIKSLFGKKPSAH